MCDIFNTRRSAKFVYIHVEDEERNWGGVRKIPVDKFDWAKKFHNMEFLSAISLPTKGDGKDEDDVMTGVNYIDEDIIYSDFDKWLSDLSY